MDNDDLHVVNAFRVSEDVSLNFETVGLPEPDVGRDLLFLPGFADSIRVWDQVRALLQAEWPRQRACFLDLKGFGLSSKPPPPSDYRIREQARLVRAFILQRGLRRPVLVAHSYGAAVALMTQVLWDELDPPAANPVTGICLLGCPAYPQRFPIFIAVLRWPVIGPASLRFTTARFRARFVLRRVIVDQAKVTEARVRSHAGFYTLPGARQAMVALAKQVVPDDLQDLVERYPLIRVPVQLVWGEQDCAIPLSSARRLQRDLPAATLDILPRCGHALHEERPELMWSILKRYLTDLGE